MNNQHNKKANNQRKKLLINNNYLLFGFLSAIFILSGFQVYSQEHVNKIELKVYPFFMYPPVGLDSELLDSVDLTITIQDSKILGLNFDEFIKLLHNLKFKEIENATADFKIKCSIYKESGDVEYFLMNENGLFFYNDKFYSNPKIKKFIFDYIPEFYKKT